MKSINSNNFNEIFPEFVRDLNEASYIAIDLEFTGIDRNPNVDFLRSPEDRFKEKIEAAHLFTPLQIGFSIFRGESGLPNDEFTPDTINNNNNNNNTSPHTASQAYREIMRRELEAFHPVEAPARALLPMLQEIIKEGVVPRRAHEWVEEVCREVRGRVPAASQVFERLRDLRALEEVEAALAMVRRWRLEISEARRHLTVRGYSCYLFPAAPEVGGDATVTLSTETVAFLLKNGMDVSKWLTECLYYTPFETYVKARIASLESTQSYTSPGSTSGASSPHGSATAAAAAAATTTASSSANIKALDAPIEALRRWINAVADKDVQAQLQTHTESIARFARRANVGDSAELNLPFIKPELRNELNNHLRALGLRCTRRVITKYSEPPVAEEENVDPESRYYGTRLLGALVTATRDKKKTLVTHHGFSDLAFLYCAIHRDPPRSFVEFKHGILDMFPVFYDTRTLTCVPSLQYMSNLTGPLKKTFNILQKQNKTVQLHSIGRPNLNNGEDLKEHDAAYDAFMTGALFAYVQDELVKSGADFRRLRCITPLHGCVFSVLFENDKSDGIVLPPSGLLFLIRRPPNVSLTADTLRSQLSPHVQSVAFQYNGDLCLITIGDTDINSGTKKEVERLIKIWCENFGYTFNILDLKSCVEKYGIVHISEKADL